MSKGVKTVSIMGCGWLGLPLAETLIESGYQVLGSTTSAEKLETLHQAGIQPYFIQVGERLEGDIRDFFESDLLLINIPPGRRRPEVERRYPEEIKRLMDSALHEGVKKLIFISSTGVYANNNRLVSEADENWVESGSGHALVRCEKYLKALPHLQLTILRLAGLVGGERKAGKFLAGKKNVPDGNAPVNMVHRDDCIKIISTIIERKNWTGTYNICADKHPSRKDFYTHQAIKGGFEPPEFLEGSVSGFKIVSNKLIKEKLGYSFLHPDPMEF